MSRSSASVAMAADSTQDALPAKTRHKKKTPATATKKKKLVTKKVKKSQVKKTASSPHDSSDDCSEHDSDLDLSRDLKPIGDYMRDRQVMMTEMLRSISNRKLQAMLPPILKALSMDDLRGLCMEQLLLMSKKRVRRLLAGDDPDAISSTGSEESSSEEETQESSDVVKADNAASSQPVSTDQSGPADNQPTSDVTKSNQPATETLPCNLDAASNEDSTKTDERTEDVSKVNNGTESSPPHESHIDNDVTNDDGFEPNFSKSDERVQSDLESHPDSGSDSDASQEQVIEDLPPAKKLRKKKRVEDTSEADMEEGEVVDSEYETDTDSQDEDTQQEEPLTSQPTDELAKTEATGPTSSEDAEMTSEDTKNELEGPASSEVAVQEELAIQSRGKEGENELVDPTSSEDTEQEEQTIQRPDEDTENEQGQLDEPQRCQQPEEEVETRPDVIASIEEEGAEEAKVDSDEGEMLKKDVAESEGSLTDTDVGIELGVSEEMRLEIDNESEVGSSLKSRGVKARGARQGGGVVEDVGASQMSPDVVCDQESSSDDDVTVTINYKHFSEREEIAKMQHPVLSSQRLIVPSEESDRTSEVETADVPRTVLDSTRTVIIKSPAELQQPPSTVSGRRIVLKRKAQSSQATTSAQPEVISPKRRSLPESTPEAASTDQTEPPSQAKTVSNKRQVIAPASSVASTKVTVTPIAKEALSQTHMEIVELELRARAIKAMLKAQEEFEKHSTPIKKAQSQAAVKVKSAVSKKKEGLGTKEATKGKSPEVQRRVIRLIPRDEKKVERKVKEVVRDPSPARRQDSRPERRPEPYQDLSKEQHLDRDQNRQREGMRREVYRGQRLKPRQVAQARPVAVPKTRGQKFSSEVVMSKYERRMKSDWSDPEEAYPMEPSPRRAATRYEPRSKRAGHVDVHRREVHDIREERGRYQRRPVRGRRSEDEDDEMDERKRDEYEGIHRRDIRGRHDEGRRYAKRPVWDDKSEEDDEMDERKRDEYGGIHRRGTHERRDEGRRYAKRPVWDDKSEEDDEIDDRKRVDYADIPRKEIRERQNESQQYTKRPVRSDRREEEDEIDDRKRVDYNDIPPKDMRERRDMRGRYAKRPVGDDSSEEEDETHGRKRFDYDDMPHKEIRGRHNESRQHAKRPVKDDRSEEDEIDDRKRTDKEEIQRREMRDRREEQHGYTRTPSDGSSDDGEEESEDEMDDRQRTDKEEIHRREMRDRRERRERYDREDDTDETSYDEDDELDDRYMRRESPRSHHQYAPRRASSHQYRGRSRPYRSRGGWARGLGHGTSSQRGFYKGHDFRGRPQHRYTPTFSRERRPARRARGGRYLGHSQSGRHYDDRERSRSRE